MFLPLLLAASWASSPHLSIGTQSGPQSVPFELNESQIILPVTVNGRELKLVFDTGFGATVIVDSNTDLGKPNGSTQLEDFVGTLSVQTIPMKSLKIGNVSVPLTGDDALAQPDLSEFGDGVHVDGLMGLNAVKNLVTEINFKEKKMIFYPSGLDLSKRVPDNKTTFLIQMEPIGARAITLPVLTSDGKPFHMELDTGNGFFATVNRDALERVGLWKDGQKPKFIFESGVASGAVDSWAKKMTGLKIFGVTVPSSTFDIIDRPAANSLSDGTVGFQFLKNFNITMDFKHRLVWMENWTGKVSEPALGDLGLSAFWSKRQKSVVIVRVAPDSPGAQAGIKEGDLLLDVDDNDLNNISYERMRRYLQGPVGSKVKISVSRGGISRRLNLERVELVND